MTVIDLQSIQPFLSETKCSQLLWSLIESLTDLTKDDMILSYIKNCGLYKKVILPTSTSPKCQCDVD